MARREKRKYPQEPAEIGNDANEVLTIETIKTILCKLPYFHVIFWCGSFVERRSFRIASGESPKPMQKLCLSTKFPHQEVR